MAQIPLTTFQLWNAYIGRGVSLFLAAFVIIGILTGFGGGVSIILGALFGYVGVYITTHDFLATSMEIDEAQNELVLHGQRFKAGFEPAEKRFSLAGLATVELTSQEWYQNSDKLTLTGAQGLSQVIMVAPGRISAQVVASATEKLTATA